MLMTLKQPISFPKTGRQKQSVAENDLRGCIAVDILGKT